MQMFKKMRTGMLRREVHTHIISSTRQISFGGAIANKGNPSDRTNI